MMVTKHRVIDNLREAFKKNKRSKLGICPNMGGRGPPGSQPLNRVFKNAQNALKHVTNTKTFFSFLGGLGQTLRNICLSNILHWVYRGDIRLNAKFF